MANSTNFEKVKKYYSNPEVQKAIIDVAKDREVVSVFKDGKFGKRPNILQYPADILQAVREGTLSFHGSVERWKQPMKLKSGMTKQELDALRKGWDVLIDIDVPDFEIAKLVVQHIIKALKDHGVSSVSLKFTGGKSFHMGVPFEALPKKINMKEMHQLYPSAAQRILEYIKWYTTEQLREELIELDNPVNLANRVGKEVANIVNENGLLQPFKIADMDIFGSRHMFRLPYSLHEKSMLVSLPINSKQLEKFQKADAEPDKVKVERIFLKRDLRTNDAQMLVVEAFDWAAKYMKEDPINVAKEGTKKKVFAKKPLMKIAEEEFPPCIKGIFGGVADGRKRSIFILINFLRNMGWKPEEIEKRLTEWNEKNYPPIRTNYIRSQFRWHIQQERNLLPPNCSNDNFYCSFGVCKPDTICAAGSGLHPNAKIQPCSAQITMKNPINYAFRKMKKEGKLKPKSDAKQKPKKRRVKKFYNEIKM